MKHQRFIWQLRQYPQALGMLSQSNREWPQTSDYSKRQRLLGKRWPDYGILLAVLQDGAQKVLGDLVKVAPTSNPTYRAWVKFPSGANLRYRLTTCFQSESGQRQAVSHSHEETISLSDVTADSLKLTRVKFDFPPKINEPDVIPARLSPGEFDSKYGSEERTKYCVCLGIASPLRELPNAPKMATEALTIAGTAINCEKYVAEDELAERVGSSTTRFRTRNMFWLSDDVPGRLVRWTQQIQADDGTIQINECELVSRQGER